MNDEFEQVCLTAGESDEYRLSKIGFSPDVVYDIGADVGSVTMHAHKLFPKAKVVAVEPHPWSYPRLAKNVAGIPEIVAINAAIGLGQMYETPDAASPLNWMCMDQESPTWTEGLVPSSVQSVMLSDLYAQHGGQQYVVKIDIEGGEYRVITHPESRKVLLDSSYFAAEFHYWGRTGDLMNKVVEALQLFLFELAQTHTIYAYSYGACSHVWAKRRTGGVEAWLQ